MPLENYENEGLEKIPDLRISQWLFELQSDKIEKLEYDSIKKKLAEEITTHNMVPYYESISKKYPLAISADQLKKMAAENAKKLTELDEKIKDAETNLGDTEVRDAMIEKAHFFSRIGDKQKTLDQLNLVLEKTLMPGARLDCLFHLIRVGFFYDDRKLVTENIEKANKIIEEGGDWDRRNRLKVYRGLFHMAGRDFVSASDEFIHAVATFTSYELMDYKRFIVYTVLTSMIALKRPELREKIIRGSEIQEILHSLPMLKEYLMSLFECRYADFFRYLTGIEQFLLKDRYLSIHARYYIKEMRILAYSQHLNSYRSINLESMAKLFGVSLEFLDNDISRFISAGLLMCKIDKVNGIIETTRPDSVNFLYQSVIKHGDVLLNRIQKLSQVINI